MKSRQSWKIGIIGTGFIGSGLKRTIDSLPDMDVSAILTRRDLQEFPGECVYTHSVQQLIDKSDLIVECNGNPIYATDVLCSVLDAGLPVVTSDAELHVTTGSYLASKGLITEAEGDQPGALAALNRRLVAVGFKPLVYGNLKGFLNPDPTQAEMRHWSKVQGISIEQVTEATDGTKIQIEQVFVANGLGAVIPKQGLYGLESKEINEGAQKLAAIAKQIGSPISDYLLCSPKAKERFPAGVFIVGEHEKTESETMNYLKLGEGPFYTLLQNFHFIYLDIPLTIREVLDGRGVLLNNGAHPTASVAAVAKCELPSGSPITREDRHFKVRGEAVRIKEAPGHVPIGLLYNTILKRKVERGQMLHFDDIEMDSSKALDAWLFTQSQAGY
ncbi:MAG: NAD(P)-dependent oxidoreductase [Brevefilum sp.]